MTHSTPQHAAKTALNPAFPVMHAPEFPKWRVTFQDREWSFETMAEAQAFGLGFAAGKAAK